MSYYRNLKQLKKAIRVRELETEIAEEKLKLHLKQIKKEFIPRALFGVILGRISKNFSLKNLWGQSKSKKKETPEEG